MKKKKGFTLVELIVVCAIMVIIVGIAVPVVINQIDKANEKSDAVFFESVESAAFTGVTQLRKAGKDITDVNNIIEEAYKPFNGQYNKANPIGSIKGAAVYVIIPEGTGTLPSDGNYITIQLVKLKSNKASLASCGFVTRLYKTEKGAKKVVIQKATKINGLSLPDGATEYDITNDIEPKK